MDVPDGALRVDHCHQRHSAPLEQLDLLAVLQRHFMRGIRQPDEGQPLVLPVHRKSLAAVRADSQDLGTPLGELFIFVPKARQLRAAVGSEKTPQKGQDKRATAELRKTYQPPLR